ncbi:MAG: hypothetical protein PHN69_03915 [Candidatus Pacebacteria bacterium]|nr:hypothetical protein [Candidatus Paceibacterota bacterium]
MKWQDAKQYPEKVLEGVNQHGIRGFARKVGVSHVSVIKYMKKHDLKQTPAEKEGQVERKPKYEKTEKGYLIHYGNRHKVAITEEELEEALALYCVANLTINETSIKMGLTRKEMYAIKTAFSITKDSMPFTPEQIDSHTAEELAEKMRTKKLQYALQRYEVNKYADIERRVKEMDQAQYWHTELCKRVNKITPKVYTLRQPKKEKTILAAYVADVHSGLEVDNYFNTYNIDIMHKRFEKLASEIACTAESKVHIADLGDTVHGIIHGSTQKYSTWVTDATMEVIKGYEQLFLTLLEEGFEVYFSKVNGSHESIEKAKNDRTEEENLGNFIYDMLKWKYSEQANLHFIDKVKGLNASIIPIFDYSILTIHGDNNSQKAVIDAERLFRRYNILEINAGHIHHRKVEDQNGIAIYFNEPFCGTDQYAGNKLLSATCGTRLVEYTREGRSSEKLVRY